jgi:hypothetical protein
MKKVDAKSQQKNAKELFKHEQVNIFTIVEDVENKEFHVLYGNFRLNEEPLDEETARIKATNVTWETISQVIGSTFKAFETNQLKLKQLKEDE